MLLLLAELDNDVNKTMMRQLSQQRKLKSVIYKEKLPNLKKKLKKNQISGNHTGEYVVLRA